MEKFLVSERPRGRIVARGVLPRRPRGHEQGPQGQAGTTHPKGARGGVLPRSPRGHEQGPQVRRGQPFQKEPAESSHDALVDMSRVPRDAGTTLPKGAQRQASLSVRPARPQVEREHRRPPGIQDTL